jgi:predicted alpha/beta superfamily hydrolase
MLLVMHVVAGLLAARVHSDALPGRAIDPRPGVTGTVRLHEQVHSSLSAVPPRNVVVWLPPGYSDPANAERRYPVLYMHDGQNVLDPSTAFLGREWRVDEVAERLVREGRIPPLIIVGIWNTPGRVAEYTPDQDMETNRADGKPQGRGGRGLAYLSWIVTDLKPMIDAQYRTRSGPSDTAMMGSSLGGIISLAAAEHHATTFGRVAAVSPSLWWNQGSVIDRWTARAPAIERLWICMGDRERRGLSEQLRRFEAAIRPAYGQRLHAEVVPGGTHDEPSWSARLDRMLMFLMVDPLDRAMKAAQPAPPAPGASPSSPEGP